MKRTFTQVFMTALVICAGASGQAAQDLQSTLATAPAAEVPSEQTSNKPVDLLAETADSEDTGTTDDLHTAAHLSIEPGNAPGTSRHPALLGDSDGAVVATSTPRGNQISVPHVVPEPSSQTAVYVLSGAVGLGFVVMRRRRWSRV